MLPSRDREGRPAPPCASAIRASRPCSPPLAAFGHLLEGVTNRGLRSRVASLLPGYTPRQMTYDLRRLCGNGFVVRI